MQHITNTPIKLNQTNDAVIFNEYHHYGLDQMYTYELVYCQPTRNCTYAEGGHSTCHRTSGVLLRYNTNVPTVELLHLDLYTCNAEKLISVATVTCWFVG